MKPIILSTASISEDEKTLTLSRANMDALCGAGAVPVITDCCNQEEIDRLLSLAKGVFLPGGGDVDPLLFGEVPIPELGIVSPLRDAFEVELAKAAIEREMPIFGICRGAQILNVALEGTVCQDIYCQQEKKPLKHQQSMPREYGSHQISIKGGSLLYSILGKESLVVNSFHHQAVGRLGKGAEASAWSQDGIIEAIELKGAAFCLGVQWHPEYMAAKHREQELLFKAFVSSCIKNR